LGVGAEAAEEEAAISGDKEEVIARKTFNRSSMGTVRTAPRREVSLSAAMLRKS
jgi:hypothetical protein